MSNIGNFLTMLFSFIIISVILWNIVYKNAPKVKRKNNNPADLNDMSDLNDIEFLFQFLAKTMREIFRIDRINLKIYENADKEEKVKKIKSETIEDVATSAYRTGFKNALNNSLRRTENHESNIGDDWFVDDLHTYRQNYQQYWDGVPNELRSVFFDRKVELTNKKNDTEES